MSTYSSALEEVAVESKRSAKISGIGAAVIDIFAFGSALAEYLPPWAAVTIGVAAPISAYAFYQKRRVSRLMTVLERLPRYDRRYTRYVSNWIIRDGPIPGYHMGNYHSERDLVAITPVSYLTFNMSRRGDGDISFTGAVVESTFARRSGPGSCVFHPLHRTTTNLAFRVEFDPKLQPGETAQVIFDIMVPAYKPASLTTLRARPKPVIEAPGESEYSSLDMLYPIDLLTKTLTIPSRFVTANRGLQVLSGQEEYTDEMSKISEANAFEDVTVTLDGEEARRLQLTRVAPPIGASYRIYWTPSVT